MAATKWNQDLNAGEHWWADINLKNDAGANRPINNHTLASCIKRHYKAVKTKEAIKIEVLNGLAGQIKLSLTATQTSNLKFGKWLYDVELTDQRGSVVSITGDGSGAEAVAVIDTATGAISGITVVKGGTGYTAPPVITITDIRSVNAPEVNGSGATATATIADGVVTGITVTAGGINYVEQPKERVIEGIITIRPEVTDI